MIVLKVVCVNVNKFADKETVRFTQLNVEGEISKNRASLSIEIGKDDPLFDAYQPSNEYDLSLETPS